jgi:predicted regulator of Ras-like GTPase activity (Roadblock/LC7/MglB family)
MKGTFVFSEDFAGNWKKGQEVVCEDKDNGILVDGVAVIETEELMKHGQFNEQSSQVYATASVLKSKALSLYQELNESELPYEEFTRVQNYILNLFSDIN